MEENRKRDMEETKIVSCYCCYKEYNSIEIEKISATTSGKCLDGTNAELRFVCKKCNHLEENNG
jgi:hypothetical protein